MATACEDIESWIEIEDAPDYIVSSWGRVFGLQRRRYLTPSQDTYGYMRVTLSANGISKPISVHRLVAKAFMPNPEGKPEVDHTDNDTNNNHIRNLQWCTPSENSLKREKRSISAIGNKKKVEQVSPIREIVVKTWASASEAADRYGVDQTAIAKCCRGEYEKCCGWRWRYRQELRLEERWKPLEHHGYTYVVSDLGRIKLANGAVTEGSIHGKYLRVRSTYVHILVAAAFLEKPDNTEVVDHIDNDGKNNRADNLRWISKRGNSQAAEEMGAMKHRRRSVQRTRADGTVQIWSSLKGAGADTGVDQGDIGKFCRGKRKAANGDVWTYADGVDDDPKPIPYFSMVFRLEDVYGIKE